MGMVRKVRLVAGPFLSMDSIIHEYSIACFVDSPIQHFVEYFPFKTLKFSKFRGLASWHGIANIPVVAACDGWFRKEEKRERGVAERQHARPFYGDG